VQFLGNVLVDGFIHWASPINFGIKLTVLNPQRGGDESAMPMVPASILETVLRVALCQPASCNLTASCSCVQPSCRRRVKTCRQTKFSFFMPTDSDSHALQS
jgi:hypothetical protein